MVTPEVGVVTSQTIVSQAITSLKVISSDLSALFIVPTTLGLAFGQRSVGVARPSSRPTLTKSLSSRGTSPSGTRSSSHSPLLSLRLDQLGIWNIYVDHIILHA